MRADADEVLSTYEALAEALGGLWRARTALQVLDGRAYTLDQVDLCLKRQRCADILRERPTISNLRLARELNIGKSTAHKWRQDILRQQISSTDRVTVDGTVE